MLRLKKRLKDKLSNSLFSYKSIQIMRIELHLLLIRIKNLYSPLDFYKRFKFKKIVSPKIHWGCGSKIIEGWINIDGWYTNNIDYVADLRSKIPFDDNVVSFIFTEHVVEHIEKKHILSVLGEFYRVLRVGGVVRIVVPSLEAFINSYQAHDMDWFKRAGFDEVTPGECFNIIFYEHFHKHIYDFENLSMLLKKVGFSSINTSMHMGSDYPELLLDTSHESRIIQSIYVEAIK